MGLLFCSMIGNGQCTVLVNTKRYSPPNYAIGTAIENVRSALLATDGYASDVLCSYARAGPGEVSVTIVSITGKAGECPEMVLADNEERIRRGVDMLCLLIDAHAEEREYAGRGMME